MEMPIRPITGDDAFTPYGTSHCVLQPGKVKKVYAGFTNNVYSGSGDDETNPFNEAIEKVEVIPEMFGALCTKMEAAANGYSGILTPVGVGTFLEDYHDAYIIDGGNTCSKSLSYLISVLSRRGKPKNSETSKKNKVQAE
jgi:acyl CoA:acetate/3-ketoacid CoA transferase alpha subunit